MSLKNFLLGRRGVQRLQKMRYCSEQYVACISSHSLVHRRRIATYCQGNSKLSR
nr:MAG TPA: hypothetical protein [Inoviridae sp.]